MTTPDSARARFLAKVEEHAPGQAVRFAPALDALIQWSTENGLTFDPPTAAQAVVRYRAPGSKLPFWAATPRGGDGAKLAILAGAGFPAALRDQMRADLAKLDLKEAKPDGPPELAFTRLIWAPHRATVLQLLTTALAALSADPAPAAAPADPSRLTMA